MSAELSAIGGRRPPLAYESKNIQPLVLAKCYSIQLRKLKSYWSRQTPHAWGGRLVAGAQFNGSGVLGVAQLRP
jgi:hypothetical protein